MNGSFWHGKKVFLTGHTGFKGSWLTLWLQALGAKVTGYSLAPETDPSLFSPRGLAMALSPSSAIFATAISCLTRSRLHVLTS